MDSEDAIKLAAVAASSNVPLRSRKGTTRKSSQVLDNFKHLPDYLQDNEFIVGSYRRAGAPVSVALKSLLRLHNESGNIWTHLMGFLLFLILTFYIARSPPAPLAASGAHVDRLWETLKDQFKHVSGNIHNLEENLIHLRENIEDNLHFLTSQLQGSLQHGVTHIQDNLQYVGNHLNDKLQHALSKFLLWPTVRWPIYVYMAGAMTCLLLSSICHLFGCCAQHVSQWLWRLDYTGIATLIVASFYPAVYYGFLCEPFWRTLYLLVISTLGMFTIIVSLMSRFQKAEYRAFRANLFAGLGLCGTIPLIHSYFLHSDSWHMTVAVRLEALMGLTYLSGAAVYAMRVPERWLPGRFDLMLHSHQIFHIAVVLAAYIHYRAIMLMLEWRDASGGCAMQVTQPLPQLLKELGQDLFGKQQVWERLQAHVFNHWGLPPPSTEI